MALPPRRKPKPSGIERAPRREFPAHRAFVRRHQCCVPGCVDGPIEFAHIRTAANSGTAVKPHDQYGLSLCAGHHKEAHDHGHKTFAGRHRIDLEKLAAEFAAKTTDTALRDAMKAQGEFA